MFCLYDTIFAKLFLNQTGSKVQEPCMLNCLAVNSTFYKTFGSARDGTRCSMDKYDMCISGTCMVSLFIIIKICALVVLVCFVLTKLVECCENTHTIYLYLNFCQ